LPVGQIISTSPRHLVSQEGRLAIVTDAGRNAVDVDGAKDERARRTDGEVVWSRHLDAGVKQVAMLAHRDVRRRQERPIAGESTKEPVKTIARGRPDRIRRNLW
jgi:hypothetical protein